MIPRPYLVFLADAADVPLAKTAFGVRDWTRQDCVGQLRLPNCAVDLGLDDLTPADAAQRGARSLLIGVASIGGAIPPHWLSSLVLALEAGLDLISGMHTRLSALPEIKSAAERLGRRLYDVRHNDRIFGIATGQRRAGKRLLTVGTDCALGKKYTALALARAFRAAGLDADFRATGQTGIMIAGDGIAIDAVVADFLTGAAEAVSPDAAADHWDVIEGQGSLFHPAYAPVTLGLVHGSQPDVMVLCHDSQRRSLHSHPSYPVVKLDLAIERYVEAASLTNPNTRVGAISLNTSRMSPERSRDVIAETELAFGLPCFDPVRSDIVPLVGRIVS